MAAINSPTCAICINGFAGHYENDDDNRAGDNVDYNPVYLPSCLHTFHQKCILPCEIERKILNRNAPEDEEFGDFPDIRDDPFCETAQFFSMNQLFPKAFFRDVILIRCPQCCVVSAIPDEDDLPVNHTLIEKINNGEELPEGMIRPDGVAAEKPIKPVFDYINKNILTKALYNASAVAILSVGLIVVIIDFIAISIITSLKNLYAILESPVGAIAIYGLGCIYIGYCIGRETTLLVVSKNRASPNLNH